MEDVATTILANPEPVAQLAGLDLTPITSSSSSSQSTTHNPIPRPFIGNPTFNAIYCITAITVTLVGSAVIIYFEPGIGVIMGWIGFAAYLSETAQGDNYIDYSTWTEEDYLEDYKRRQSLKNVK